MTDSQPTQNPSDNEPAKKITLAEAAKQLLAQKKQAQAGNKAQSKHHPGNQPMTMKSQQTKKSNNQRRRTGV